MSLSLIPPDVSAPYAKAIGGVSMSHAMYVRLTTAEAEALHRLAVTERRTMRDQAALVLAEGLRQCGLLNESGQAVVRYPGPSDGEFCMEGDFDGTEA